VIPQERLDPLAASPAATALLLAAAAAASRTRTCRERIEADRPTIVSRNGETASRERPAHGNKS